ncbi:hypothetical protein [Methylobacterium aquaticum]|nr:hypothetical protein [Methylobacterium aquaticum]QRE77172.1 hypothetical protein F1D61_29790 [Methylobacterium aquaticum]
MRKMLAAFARALAAMGLVMVMVVWEGGKLVLKTVRGVLAPRPPVAEAEAELAHEMAQPAGPKPPSPAEAWGRAALHYLMGEAPEASAALDDAARAYLDALSEDQQVALAQHDNRTVGRHLLRERLLPDLPRPMSPSEYRNIEATRAAAGAAEAHQRLVGDDAKRRHFIEVLDELLAEPMPRGL